MNTTIDSHKIPLLSPEFLFYHKNVENSIEISLTSTVLANCSVLEPAGWASLLSLLGLLAKIKV